MKAVCLHTTSRRRRRASEVTAVRQVGYMGRPPAGVTARRLSRNRMSAPQDCPIRTILLMTTFQGHVALHRRNVNKRREGHSMTRWTQFGPFLTTYLPLCGTLFTLNIDKNGHFVPPSSLSTSFCSSSYWTTPRSSAVTLRITCRPDQIFIIFCKIYQAEPFNK